MSKKNENGKRGQPQCANCFACVKDTDMCPLNENYDPEAAHRRFAERLAKRKEQVKDVDGT